MPQISTREFERLPLRVHDFLAGITERTNRSSRVRMEAWRQWQLGREKKVVQAKPERIHLTATGLHMEGDYTQNPCGGTMSAMAM